MNGMIWCQVLVLLLAVKHTNGRISYEVIRKLMDKLKANCILGKYPPTRGKGCAVNFDTSLSCWPPTPSNTTVSVRCAYVLFGEGYSSRECLANGTWSRPSTRQTCKFLPSKDIRKRRNELILQLFDDSVALQKIFDKEENDILHRHRLRKVTLVLRSVDLAVCLFSLILIFGLVPMKDRRFVLHRFLILAFAACDFLVILLHYSYQAKGQRTICSTEHILVNYFLLVQVCMMFSEGFYQFRQFYYVFVSESRVQSYVVFAYVAPIFVVFGAYVPAYYFDSPIPGRPMAVCWKYYDTYKFNYIILAPMFLLLLLNFLITIYMMNLIVTKLKREKTLKTTKAKKGARGFLVLIVLLGFGYMVTLYGPSSWWFKYFKEAVKSTQGMLICLLQVFFSNQMLKGCRRGKRKLTQRAERISNQRVRRSIPTNTKPPSKETNPNPYHEDKQFSTGVTNKQGNTSTETPEQQILKDTCMQKSETNEVENEKIVKTQDKANPEIFHEISHSNNACELDIDLQEVTEEIPPHNITTPSEKTCHSNNAYELEDFQNFISCSPLNEQSIEAHESKENNSEDPDGEDRVGEDQDGEEPTNKHDNGETTAVIGYDEQTQTEDQEVIETKSQ